MTLKNSEQEAGKAVDLKAGGEWMYHRAKVGHVLIKQRTSDES